MVAKRKSTTQTKQETSKNPGKTIASDNHKSSAKTAPQKTGTKAETKTVKTGPVKPPVAKMKKTKNTTTKTTATKKAAAKKTLSNSTVDKKLASTAAAVKTGKKSAKTTKPEKTADKTNKATKASVSKENKTTKSTTRSITPKRRSRKKTNPDLVSFKPYVLRKHEEYMNENQKVHFVTMLLEWRKQLMEEVDRTVSHMKDEAANYPDPSDRASQEEEFSIELRTRDRERKLIRKIEKTIDLLDQDDYGYCESCGIEIGIRRLEARPTATQCIDCKTLDELKERQIHG
jgi:DnaK suppressor protein